MGGRLASQLLDEPAGRAADRASAVPADPTLILQGERDSFGRREELESYTPSPHAQLGWIACGNHSFKPTLSDGVLPQVLGW